MGNECFYNVVMLFLSDDRSSVHSSSSSSGNLPETPFPFLYVEQHGLEESPLINAAVCINLLINQLFFDLRFSSCSLLCALRLHQFRTLLTGRRRGNSGNALITCKVKSQTKWFSSVVTPIFRRGAVRRMEMKVSVPPSLCIGIHIHFMLAPRKGGGRCAT